MSSPAKSDDKRIPGCATPQGTLRYAARFQGRAAAGHFRDVQAGLVLSSIGIGTYLGEADEATDKGYTSAVVAAVEGGINVVDSAINYRLQRSERSVGAALKQLAAKGFPRDEIVLCTKAGFLTPDGEMPDDANEYFAREFIEPGIFRPEDIAAGCHCMTPRYLADQLDRSRRNLGVECVDVFYLHNPETQLSEVPREEFRRRIGEAFKFLESAVAAGKIGAYGLATWNAFREDPKSQGYLSLAAMEEIAREEGGLDHHFRFVQLPLNLAMPEALLRPNQVVEGKTMAMVQAARALKITLSIERGAAAGPAHAEFAALYRCGSGHEERFGERAAIRPIGSRRHHRACRHEPRRARPRQSRSDRHRARPPRSVPQVIRTAQLESQASALGFSSIKPRINGSSNLIELAREKMVRALDDDEPLWLRQRGEERFDTGARPELIVPTLNDEFRLLARSQKTHVNVVHRQSQADQLRHARVTAAHSQAHR